MQQKLTGKALLNFVKQCEFDALAACANPAAGKPDSDSFMDVCTAKAMEWGRAGATHIGARRPPIAQAGRDAVCAGLVFAESDNSASNGNLRCNAAKEAPGRTRYAILGHRQFAGSVRIPAPRTYQQRVPTLLSSPRARKRCSGGIPWNRYYSPPCVGRFRRSYRGEADITQPKIHEDEDPDHQKGEVMDPPLLAIADGFREGIGKVRETR